MPKATKTLVKCPLCGEGSEEFEPRGLFGHLRFKHHLDGDKLDRAYDNGVDTSEKQQEQQQKQQEKQALVDRISKLHDELRNVRGRLKQLRDEDESSFLSSDQATKRLRKLYQNEEKRITAELEKLLQAASSRPGSVNPGSPDKSTSAWFF